MITAGELANRLGGARREGNGYRALCPAHEDRTPSLSIVEKDGKVLFICRAGCEQKAVLEAIRSRGLWSGTARTKPNPELELKHERRHFVDQEWRRLRDRYPELPEEARAFIEPDLRASLRRRLNTLQPAENAST